MTAPQPYIFVYQTICQINGKSYIGVHKTDNLNDGYIGCGVSCQGHANRNMVFHKAVRKYGYENFKRYELDFFDDYGTALDEERHLVNLKWVKDSSNYNLAIGGEGNTTLWMDDDRKSEWRNNIKESADTWVKNGGLEKIRERSKTATRVRMFGSKNPMFGIGNPYVEKGVFQYDLNMNLVAQFDTVTQAAMGTKSNVSGITLCCKGTYLTCNGFVFRYKKYTELEKQNLDKKLKRTDRKLSESKRIAIIKDSFQKNGRKDSISFKNIKSGQVVIGVTKLSEMYSPISTWRIKKSIKSDGIFNGWIKIDRNDS